MIRHVIILGCGRSGTSIFGELFQHLPAFTYISEPPFAQLSGFDYSSPLAIKVPKESPSFSATPGLSFPLQQLRSIVPEPLQFYWQVRHPLDAICSLRVGIAQNWGHHPKPPDWREWLQRPLLERCAHHWNYINSLGFSQVRELATVSKFEQMIEQPRQFADRICAQIGLDPVAHNAALAGWALRVQNSNNEHFVEAETSKNYSRPDHSVRVARWRENLSASDVRQIAPMVAETAAQFGYDVAIDAVL